MILDHHLTPLRKLDHSVGFMSKLVNSDEVAQLLGVSRATVNRRAKAGTLPVAIKMPGRTGINLFIRRDIEALADEQVAS